MKLLDKKLPKATFRDAKPRPLEQEAFFQVKQPMSMLETLLMDLLEVFVNRIHALHNLKAKNFST